MCTRAHVCVRVCTYVYTCVYVCTYMCTVCLCAQVLRCVRCAQAYHQSRDVFERTHTCRDVCDAAHAPPAFVCAYVLYVCKCLCMCVGTFV